MAEPMIGNVTMAAARRIFLSPCMTCQAYSRRQAHAVSCVALDHTTALPSNASEPSAKDDAATSAPLNALPEARLRVSDGQAAVAPLAGMCQAMECWARRWWSVGGFSGQRTAVDISHAAYSTNSSARPSRVGGTVMPST